MNFEVEKHDLRCTRIDKLGSVALEDGEIRLVVGSFALTSNNITYASFGDVMQYWNFFPAVDKAWGRIPVWGFADVAESRHPDVRSGTRVYGFMPMSTVFVVSPGQVNERGFTDLAPHRQPMSSTYNRYAYLSEYSLHVPGSEEHHMLLWPLFFTSFLIDDVIADANRFGAESVVISSASSKTALIAAHLLHASGEKVIGLTSPDNREFVEGLGCYSSVLTYDNLQALPTETAVYVDIAGNGRVTAAVHEHYGNDLKHSMIVGNTHWNESSPPSAALPGPTPTLFFAPNQIAKRAAEWGSAELDQRVSSSWEHFYAWASKWVEFQYVVGHQAVDSVYRELLDGHSNPRVGYICSL